MKKLVALVAVLALASMASAAMLTYQVAAGTGITISGNSVTVDKNVAPSFTINVMSDTASTSFTLNVKSTVDSAVLTLGTVNSGFVTVNSPGALKSGLTGANAGCVIYNMAGSNSTNVAAGQWGNFMVAASQLADGVYTFDSMCSNGGGTGSMKGTKLGISGVTVPTLTVTVTPEPMTLALLGLGGLFLRRKSA